MKYTLRIKKNNVFKYVFKKGNYAKGKSIIVHISKTKCNNNKNFFAVCVSKKNGNSVKRNKLKRWVREVYKLEEEKLRKNYNVIIVYKKNVIFEDVNYYLVKKDIMKCFEELDLYEKN